MRLARGSSESPSAFDLTAAVVGDCVSAFRLSGKVHRLDLGGHCLLSST